MLISVAFRAAGSASTTFGVSLFTMSRYMSQMLQLKFGRRCMAMVVGAAGLAVPACGTTTPPPTMPASTTTAPAATPTAVPLSAPVATPPGPTPWPFPGQPESCGGVTVAQDGNVSPPVCPDGRPNVAAILFFAKIPSKLLALGPAATAGEVMTAACADLNAPPPNGGTIPLVTTEASLAFAENNWNFGVVTSPAQINQQMTAGACNSGG